MHHIRPCIAVICIPLFAASGTSAVPRERRATVASCRTVQAPAPGTRRLVLRTNPRVDASGQVIKGLYYSWRSGGPNRRVAFHVACDHALESAPFLVFDFDTRRFYFDHDRDGCVDSAGTMPTREIDPADFYSTLDDGIELCYAVPVS